jgi:hypothetical protein
MSTIIPLVYGLLIGKKATDYDDFFTTVLEQDDFHPETILTDFETGTIKSVKGMLPNATHKGKEHLPLDHTNYCFIRMSLSLRSEHLAARSK